MRLFALWGTGVAVLLMRSEIAQFICLRRYSWTHWTGLLGYYLKTRVGIVLDGELGILPG
jgi:hypothetical protein